MPRTRYSLTERTTLGDQLRSGRLARQYHRIFKTTRDTWATLHRNPFAFIILAELLDETAIDDLGGAFERLADRVEAMHNAIRKVMTETDRACSEERRRLRDHVDYAIARRAELGRERTKLVRRLDENGADPERLRAQMAVIEQEDGRLSYFTRTYDESVLPPDFGDRARAWRAVQEQKRAANGPRLAGVIP